jgi:hypothetical protein
VPDEHSRSLVKALQGLKAGDVSPVFELSEKSWAFVRLEERRESGPKPLEGALYDELYNTLLQRTVKTREDEWFRKALAKSLILDNQDRPIPLVFFFPDEGPPPAGTTPSASQKPAPANSQEQPSVPKTTAQP